MAVLGLGAALGVAGAWVIAGLPWPTAWRCLLGAGWAGSLLIGTLGQVRGFASAARYVVLPGGDVDVISADGRARRAAIATGTTVYRRFAWLRFRGAAGSAWGELVRAPGSGENCLKNKDWRRLQVICRHLRAC